MELKRPTKNIPPAAKSTRGKYIEVYRMVQKLKPAEWLPVIFASDKDAYNFRVAATTQRALSLEARLRGRTVYVRLRKTEKGDK